MYDREPYDLLCMIVFVKMNALHFFRFSFNF